MGVPQKNKKNMCFEIFVLKTLKLAVKKHKKGINGYYFAMNIGNIHHSNVNLHPGLMHSVVHSCIIFK